MFLRTSPRRVRVVAALFAISLLAASCGSDPATDVASGDDSGDDTGADDAAGDDTGADDAEGDDAAGDDTGVDDAEGDDTDPEDTGGDDAEGDDTDPEDTDGEDMAALDGDVELYCQLTIENQNRSDEFADFTDPAKLEEFFQRSRAGLAEAIPIAPSIIQADLLTIQTGLDDFAALLRDAGWDFFAVLDEIEVITDAPAQVEAEMRLDDFEREYCDLPDETAGSFEDAFTTPEALEAIMGSESGRRLMIDGMTEDGDLTVEQAGCLLDNLDFETLLALGAGITEPPPELIAELLAVFDACGIDPGGL